MPVAELRSRSTRPWGAGAPLCPVLWRWDRGGRPHGHPGPVPPPHVATHSSRPVSDIRHRSVPDLRCPRGRGISEFEPLRQPYPLVRQNSKRPGRSTPGRESTPGSTAGCRTPVIRHSGRIKACQTCSAPPPCSWSAPADHSAHSGWPSGSRDATWRTSGAGLARVPYARPRSWPIGSVPGSRSGQNRPDPMSGPIGRRRWSDCGR